MPKSKIMPVPGYLLIEPQKKEKVTDSGIVLPESHEEKPQQGKVLSVGGSIYNDGREVVSPCKVADVVIYREWGGKEYKDGNTDLLLLKFDDIMAVIKQ
ncbi:MAG: co-chaperone GroES [Candidatus Shapirobacteria bacterium]|nr:co-chaperone GroES [Candidatus Shapirobacteria bacterium]